jgi:hypothetical protein
MAIGVGVTQVATSRAQTSSSVVPLLNCVTFNPGANTVTGFFGYISTEPDTVAIPLENNFFSPGTPDRGQPFDFEPGRHDFVFSTSFVVSSLTPQLAWELLGTAAVAQNDPADYCENQPPAGPPGPPGPPGLANVQQVDSGPSTERTTRVHCPAGSVVLSGGYSIIDGAPPRLVHSLPLDADTWSVRFKEVDGVTYRVRAVCAEVAT